MKVCEQCGKEYDWNFGSGRFCCRSCSNKWVSLHQSEDAKKRKIEKGIGNLVHKGGFGAAKPWTKEMKLKHSEIMTRVMNNPIVKKKISEASRGRKLSAESRAKISYKVKKSHLEGRNKGWTTRKKQESYAEKFWKTVLDNNGIQYQQEYKVTKSSIGVSGVGCYFLDFLLPGNIDLEIDGHQHYEENRKLHDLERDQNLSNAGYKVCRIKYINPNNSIKVKEDIEKFLYWYNSQK